MDQVAMEDDIMHQGGTVIEDVDMTSASEEDEETDLQSVDQDVLSQYLTVMNTLLGPLFPASTSQPSTSTSTTPHDNNTEDAEPKSTVSAAKRRKMDKKKMKKEESKKFPSIVDFRLLSRTIKPISLLPPTEPLFIVPNPRHVLPSDAETESLKIKAESVAITWEDIVSQTSAPKGYGKVMNPIRFLAIPPKWRPMNVGTEWGLPFMITERARSFNPTPKHPSSSTPKNQQARVKLKRHHPIPKSHTSYPVLPIKLCSTSSIHDVSLQTSISDLRNVSTTAQTKAERRKAGRRIKARVDVGWKGKKVERKRRKRKLSLKMKKD